MKAMQFRTGRLSGIVIAASCLFLAGCGLASLRDTSFADRCAAIMEQSYPGGGDLTVTTETSAIDKSAADLTTMRAEVQAVRKDVPVGGFVLRDVAAECRFDKGILTSFHWTTGPFR